MTPPAHLIIKNANLFTPAYGSPSLEAIAIKDKYICFAGSNQAAETWRGPNTRVINGQGFTLMPGFIDSHFHLLHGSLKLADIQLDEAVSLESMAQAIQQFAMRNPALAWLVGQGVRYSVLPNATLTRQQLDAIMPDRPLILLAYDVHTAWANTEALRQGNILVNGQTIGPNSEIVQAPDGLAAGELREPGAYKPILNLLPPLSKSQQVNLLQQGLALAASLGLTSIHNMDGDAEQMALYQHLEENNELSLRVYIPFDVNPDTPVSALAEAVDMRQTSSQMVRGGCVKFFMDGVIETYTSLLLDDYADQPGNFGGALFSAEHFTAMALEADRLGLQIFVHAVGDGAVRRCLDSYQTIQQANGRRDSRHRIEHIELIHPDDIPRLAKLGVIAAMQPPHAMLTVDDPDPWLDRIPASRWEHSFAWQTLRQAGARLTFGSDWPVASPNPIFGVYCALNRQSWAKGLPSQRQTLVDTLHSYTYEPAYAEFMEHQKGRLHPGMLADLVLLSADIFTVLPQDLQRVHPILTICNGQVVFEA